MGKIAGLLKQAAQVSLREPNPMAWYPTLRPESPNVLNTVGGGVLPILGYTMMNPLFKSTNPLVRGGATGIQSLIYPLLGNIARTGRVKLPFGLSFNTPSWMGLSGEAQEIANARAQGHSLGWQMPFLRPRKG